MSTPIKVLVTILGFTIAIGAACGVSHLLQVFLGAPKWISPLIGYAFGYPFGMWAVYKLWL